MYDDILPNSNEVLADINSNIEPNPHTYTLPRDPCFSVILLLVETTTGHDIIDIKKLREDHVQPYLAQNSTKYTHYSEVLIGEDEEHADNYLLRTLQLYPNVKKQVPYKDFYWKPASVIKKTFGITKVQMNRERKKKPAICEKYNGRELWCSTFFEYLKIQE